MVVCECPRTDVTLSFRSDSDSLISPIHQFSVSLAHPNIPKVLRCTRPRVGTTNPADVNANVGCVCLQFGTSNSQPRDGEIWQASYQDRGTAAPTTLMGRVEAEELEERQIMVARVSFPFPFPFPIFSLLHTATLLGLSCAVCCLSAS